MLPTGVKTEVAFTANNPGTTLSHYHQQDHMDSGFMMRFDQSLLLGWSEHQASAG